jgi:hypothetical protein
MLISWFLLFSNQIKRDNLLSKSGSLIKISFISLKTWYLSSYNLYPEKYLATFIIFSLSVFFFNTFISFIFLGLKYQDFIVFFSNTNVSGIRISHFFFFLLKMSKKYWFEKIYT